LFWTGEQPVRFEIRATDRTRWTWVLMDETEEPVAESRRDFPSQAQATAAAMAFAQLVARAGRHLAGAPRSGGFL